jgi:predicted secreted hydrolase
MKRSTKVLIGVLIAAVIIAALLGARILLWRRDEQRVSSAGQLQPVIAPAGAATGFARAEGPRPLDFPADYGPHPDFQTEWWYYTGNLATDTGRRFGYQLTFFRRALKPPMEREDRASDWATEQVYMAHFALTDVAGEQHWAFERFSRGAAGLAGAATMPYHVWLEDWRVEQVGDDPGVMQMLAAQDDLALDLRLIDRKGPILQGDRGYSQKGPDPGNASYYYSQTRLETSGAVTVGEVIFEVEGWSWMDHEFSTSALAPDQVGWDWFAFRLEDGSDLMLFQIRKADGEIDLFSSGTLIGPGGETRRLTRDDFTIDVEETWRSPRSGTSYPSRWSVSVPSADLVLAIEPYLADQELNLSYAYWEGAVRIEGERAGASITGEGYVELTGYAGSMEEQF